MDKDGDRHQITEYIWFGLTPYAQIPRFARNFRYTQTVIRNFAVQKRNNSYERKSDI